MPESRDRHETPHEGLSGGDTGLYETVSFSNNLNTLVSTSKEDRVHGRIVLAKLVTPTYPRRMNKLPALLHSLRFR